MAVRNTMCEAKSTIVSPSATQLTLTLKCIVRNEDRAQTMSDNQDKHIALNLRESLIRLCKVESDRKQLSFELVQERDTQLERASRSNRQVMSLEMQLRELVRIVDGPAASDY